MPEAEGEAQRKINDLEQRLERIERLLVEAKANTYLTAAVGDELAAFRARRIHHAIDEALKIARERR